MQEVHVVALSAEQPCPLGRPRGWGGFPQLGRPRARAAAQRVPPGLRPSQITLRPPPRRTPIMPTLRARKSEPALPAPPAQPSSPSPLKRRRTTSQFTSGEPSASQPAGAPSPSLKTTPTLVSRKRPASASFLASPLNYQDLSSLDRIEGVARSPRLTRPAPAVASTSTQAGPAPPRAPLGPGPTPTPTKAGGQVGSTRAVVRTATPDVAAAARKRKEDEDAEAMRILRAQVKSLEGEVKAIQREAAAEVDEAKRKVQRERINHERTKAQLAVEKQHSKEDIDYFQSARDLSHTRERTNDMLLRQLRDTLATQTADHAALNARRNAQFDKQRDKIAIHASDYAALERRLHGVEDQRDAYFRTAADNALLVERAVAQRAAAVRVLKGAPIAHYRDVGAWLGNQALWEGDSWRTM